MSIANVATSAISKLLGLTVIAFGLFFIIFTGIIGTFNIDVADLFSQQPTTHIHTLVDLNSDKITLYINKERDDASLYQLRYDKALVDAAKARCDDMASRHYYNHTTPDNKPWFDTLAAYDPQYYKAGENIAAYFHDDSEQGVVADWMHSPEHRDNILSTEFTHVGVATCEGVYQNNNTVFIVTEFASYHA